MKPRLLDLFCGAGGCARGYQRAGFYVVGIDNRPQPRYAGDEFYEGDALKVLDALLAGAKWEGHTLADFGAIHASPPCQAFTRAQRIRGNEHPNLIEPTRRGLAAAGLPYVIENVPGAPLIDPLTLCGTGFALPFIRHRLFESDVWMMAPGCAHGALERYWHRGRWIRSVAPFGHEFPADVSREVMGIDWMTRDEVSEAVPPVFTEHIGGYLLAALKHEAAA